jgi:hypothetical protein
VTKDVAHGPALQHRPPVVEPSWHPYVNARSRRRRMSAPGVTSAFRRISMSVAADHQGPRGARMTPTL